MRRERHDGFQNAKQRDAHALRRSEQVVLYDDVAHTATHLASNAHTRTLSSVTSQRRVQEMQGGHRLEHVVFYENALAGHVEAHARKVHPALAEV